jgi:hypothetical protein
VFAVQVLQAIEHLFIAEPSLALKHDALRLVE